MSDPMGRITGSHGVPDVHIRPISVPGGRANPEMRCDVNVLSVEL
jgi:hypothetical protein